MNVEREGANQTSWVRKTEMPAAYGALTIYMLVILGALLVILSGQRVLPAKADPKGTLRFEGRG